jgi:hypothetical protein
MNTPSICILSLALLSAAIPVRGQINACDLNADGVVNVLDVQLAVDMDVGTLACTANIAGVDVCTPQVVQTVINTALGGTCFLHYVALGWTASSSPSIAGYNVYRSATSGGPYTKLNSSPVAAITFTDTTALAGQTYYYVCTAVNTSSEESTYSSEVSVVVPSP